MNEIFATILVALASDLIFEEEQSQEKSSEESEEAEDEALRSKKLLLELHDPKHLWSDSYILFERLMDLGVKDLYYRQAESSLPFEDEAELKMDQEELHRTRK